MVISPSGFGCSGNLDGHLDLVLANEGEPAPGKALSVLIGDGSGGFKVTSYPTGKWGSDVAVAELILEGRGRQKGREDG